MVDGQVDGRSERARWEPSGGPTMLARYPRLDSAFLRHPCPSLLPRLLIQDPCGEDGSLRSCDSAPAGRSRVFFRDQEPKTDPKLPAAAMDAVSPEVDFKRLSRCVQLLHQSGYYYEGLSWHQASLKLHKCRVGTFLVRDSENANYLFTLSVQTKKGPTSIRIAYRYGHFRLDSEDALVSRMPVFETVTDLVEYYVRASRDFVPQKNVSCCWLDLAGECSAPVELYYPLYKQVGSLKHLCRLAVVNSLREVCVPVDWTLDQCDSLGLPNALRDYIKEYPHCH